MPHALSPAPLRKQLAEQRRKVDFDTYDVTVDELLRRVGQQRIDFAPNYQRQFRWDAARQSRLVESVFLGIPVPPLFMATNQGQETGNRWEVVDGLQRLLTLVSFAGDETARGITSLTEQPLTLVALDKLSKFDGVRFDQLPSDVRTTLLDRPLKVVVLNDKSDLQVRYDLFERLNTGGISLTPQEIRECVFRGEFVDLLGDLARLKSFRIVVHLPERSWKDGTPEDFVLRFFAFHERYRSFAHSVGDFLNEFVEDAAKRPRLTQRRAIFEESFDFLAKCFPSGLRTRKGQTPVNLFEGVAVGAALAIDANHKVKPVVNPTWVTDETLRTLTTGATNSRTRVAGRIEFCRDHFLR